MFAFVVGLGVLYVNALGARDEVVAERGRPRS